MGFLSFLSTSKQRPEPQYPELKAQSYDTTAIALPPIRGSLPVQGNGPNTLSDLKRAARKRSEAQLSTRTTPAQNEAPAPSPIVARLRSKSLGRPSTAPGLSDVPLPGTSRPKSAGRNTPSFINTKRSPGPPYLIGVNGPEDDEVDTNAPPPVPPIAARFMSSLPSSPITPSRPKAAPSINGSVLSGKSEGQSSRGGKPGYVDLLDASGAFKPSDFKTRLQASGARDYGEDVAERNMGVNGVDLNSPAVLAFYTLTGGAPLAFRSDGSAVDVHGNKYAKGDIPTDMQEGMNGKGRDELGRMAEMKTRTAQFPARTSSLQPQAPFAAAGDLATRGPERSEGESRRLSLYGAPASNTSKQAKQRPLSMHPVLSTTYHSTSTAPPPEVPRTRPTSAGKTKTSSRGQSRDAKKKSSSSKEERPTSSKSSKVSDEEWARRARSGSSTSRKARKTHRQDGSDLSQFNLGVVQKDKSLPPLPSSSSRPSTSNGTDSLPRATQPRSSSQPRSHPRNRSTGATSMRSRPQLQDIDEHLTPIPRDNGSVSSAAPSTVASSNNQSRHTADTSLDLGFSMPRMSKADHGRGKSNGAASARLTYASQRAQAPSPPPKAADLDEYTTTTDGSDVESYLDKRKKRHLDGEHLLFNEQRYAPTGGGLPGLFDSNVDQDPTTPTFNKPQTSKSRPPTSAPKSYQKPPSLVSWQDNSSSSSLTVSETDLSKGFAVYDPDDDELDSKLDAKLAVKLRKEMKRRERLSTRRRTGTERMERYEQGTLADTEN